MHSYIEADSFSNIDTLGATAVLQPKISRKYVLKGLREVKPTYPKHQFPKDSYHLLLHLNDTFTLQAVFWPNLAVKHLLVSMQNK